MRNTIYQKVADGTLSRTIGVFMGKGKNGKYWFKIPSGIPLESLDIYNERGCRTGYAYELFYRRIERGLQSPSYDIQEIGEHLEPGFKAEDVRLTPIEDVTNESDKIVAFNTPKMDLLKTKILTPADIIFKHLAGDIPRRKATLVRFMKQAQAIEEDLRKEGLLK